MGARTGPFSTIRAAATYAATATWYDCTAIQMGSNANALAIYVTAGTASPGNVELKIQCSPDGTNYYEYGAGGDSPEVFGALAFSAVGNKMTVVPGIAPLEYVKVGFRASANAASATLEIKALSYQSETGISVQDIAVGDIEVTLGTDMLHAEDAAHVSGDKGVMDLAVRNDTPGALAGTDGDYAPLQVNAGGDLRVDLNTVAGAASSATNPFFAELTDGTTAIGAANPLTVQPHDGTTGAVVDATTSGLSTNLAGVAGTATDVNAGNVSAGSQRVTLATDDVNAAAINTATAATQTAVEIMDDWDESDRAKVNPIAGQAGVAAGAGAVDALTQRCILASDDPAVTSLAILDDWDETDRCAVNIISGQAGVAAGSGANGATVQRVTVATDDTVATDLTAIKTAAEIIDDWDESDRAKANIIVGQAGVAAGSGANGATVQRVTVATDDTVATDLTAIKTAVEIMDDWDDGSDHCQIDIAAQTLTAVSISKSSSANADNNAIVTADTMGVPGTQVQRTFTSASARTGAGLTASTRYSFTPTEDVYWTFGDGACTATSASYYQPGKTTWIVTTPASDTYVAALRVAVDGTLNMIPLTD